MSFDTQHEASEPEEVTNGYDSNRKTYLVLLA